METSSSSRCTRSVASYDDPGVCGDVLSHIVSMKLCLRALQRYFALRRPKFSGSRRAAADGRREMSGGERRSTPLYRFSHFSLVALLCVGCKENRDAAGSTSGAPVAPSVVEALALGVDGGEMGEPLDPPAPSGDLAEELEHFVNVDTCVAQRAKLDPLVGDALSAIGYETFLRDACRLLEAAKDRKRDTCDRIDSSALRARCQSWVAMVSQAPDACPLQFEGLVTRGRDPSCVAIASREGRLCSGEPRAVSRATCTAMVARDPSKCDVLLSNQRPLCRREVARWRGVLPPPLEGLDKLPSPRVKLSLRGISGTPDPLEKEVELTSELARGAVIVTANERMRVELGTVGDSDAARIAASPQKKARVGLAMLLEPSKDGVRPTMQRLELELPAEAPIVSPPSTCDCRVTVARATPTRGAEVAFAVTGTLSSGTRSYDVSIEATTFVRDVVAETADKRILPPIHPLLPSRAGQNPRRPPSSDGH